MIPWRVLSLLLLFACDSYAAPLHITSISNSPSAFSFAFPTATNRKYAVTFGTLAPPNFWHTLTNVSGNDSVAVIRDPANQGSAKFYRVFTEAPLRFVTLGHVTPTTARFALGTDGMREVRIFYSTHPDLENARWWWRPPFIPAEDYTGVIDLSSLTPATTYFYNIVVDGQPLYSPPYPNFVTAPPHGAPGTVRIAFGSCFRGSSGGGYGAIDSPAPPAADQIWRSMAAKSPHLFLHLGDTAYCDNMGANDLNGYRLVHRHSLDERLPNMSGYAAFRRHFPFYTTWDDHEIRNDYPWDPLQAAAWSPGYLPMGKQAFREYHGRGNPNSPTPGELYYSLQFGDVGVFMTDTRSFRSFQQNEDNTNKTILGAVQKQHLKSWLLQNKEALRFKLIATATPIHGLSEHITRKDAWGAGYETELNEILDFTITHQIRNVLFLSGDQHWSGSFKRERQGVNFFDFMSSPLSSSTFSRYTGTNQTLLARVNWMFDVNMNQGRGENFGLITARTDISPATLRFDLFDAAGQLLNATSIAETPSGLQITP